MHAITVLLFTLIPLAAKTSVHQVRIQPATPGTIGHNRRPYRGWFGESLVLGRPGDQWRHHRRDRESGRVIRSSRSFGGCKGGRRPNWLAAPQTGAPRGAHAGGGPLAGHRQAL